MNNQYYIMRHGESKANAKGIILSDPQIGCEDWGLTEKGRIQARESASQSILDKKCLIFSSDFLRAAETARVVAQTITCQAPGMTTLLRERYFGELDQSSHQNYSKVWDKDRLDENNTIFGVESPSSVLKRLLKFLQDCENQYKNQTILLVSHGDPLQILLSYCEGLPLTEHRQVRHLETAEIRKLRDLTLKK